MSPIWPGRLFSTNLFYVATISRMPRLERGALRQFRKHGFGLMRFIINGISGDRLIVYINEGFLKQDNNVAENASVPLSSAAL